MKNLTTIILAFLLAFASQSVFAQKRSNSQVRPANRAVASFMKKHIKAIKQKDETTVKATMLGTFPSRGFNIGMPPALTDSIFVSKAYDLNPNDLSVYVRSSKKYPKAATSISIKPGSKAYKALKAAGKDPNYYMMFHVSNQSGYKIASIR